VPNIRLICDGGGAFGFGNLRRSSTLAWEFKRRGFGVFVEVISEPAAKLLPVSPHDVDDADLWLLDIPYDADSWVEMARARRLPVVALDYQGGVTPDLVISVFSRGTAPAAAKQLVGLEYAIIRPDIAALSPAGSGHGVMVVIGGGDQDGLGEHAASLMHQQGCDVRLIDGPLSGPRSKDFPREIVRVNSPSDLASRMASCGWAITSGGGTMLEMMCLAKPVHVLPRTPHEEMLARSILGSGGLLGIGFESLTVPSSEACESVSERARSLVDGNGAKRIMEAVCQLL
jgi:spore coat polysaccharide biosynthesis predicted glycosyltransferase SpsG